MRTKLHNLLLIAGLSILLAGSAYFGYHVHKLVKEQQVIKQDYSLVNSITLGLFSIDTWRDRLSDVMNDRINGYSITPQQKKDIQAAVEKELHAMLAKVIKEIDKPQKSIGGKIKKMAFHVLADSDSLQAQVPPFARTIVRKVSSPSSQARLKDIASSKMNELEDQTYDQTTEANAQVTKFLFHKYKVTDAAGFDRMVDERLDTIWALTIKNTLFMFACVIAAVLLWVLMRKQVHLQTTLFVMALLFAAVLLTVGLTCPIIEVDARIKSLDFILLGEHVTFQNQVLFFQSKSISGIITTLLTQQKPEAATVGILILLFIVLLPFIRLTAKSMHMFYKNNKVINYLAFEAGKWDMADVMIVGMLMTFIGLNGILRSQLTDLNIHTAALTTHTVNYTSLQPGYFIFMGYVVFELVLSYILRKMAPAFVKPKRRYRKTKQLDK
jgi:hypothetical protein